MDIRKREDLQCLLNGIIEQKELAEYEGNEVNRIILGGILARELEKECFQDVKIDNVDGMKIFGIPVMIDYKNPFIIETCICTKIRYAKE
jgi:hypothetical protein